MSHLNIWILQPNIYDACHIIEYVDIDTEYPFVILERLNRSNLSLSITKCKVVNKC